MYYGDTFRLASLILIFIAGFFIGRLFSGRFFGWILTLIIGVFAIVMLSSLLISGTPSLFLVRVTENLSRMLLYNFWSFVVFCFGVLIGWRRRRR